MKRDNNEDNFLVFPEQNLFAVFDGMGGHAAGEVASGIAVREMKEFFDLTGKDPDATWPFKDDRAKNYDENRLVTAIKLCNARIIETSENDPKPGDIFMLMSDGLSGMVEDKFMEAIMQKQAANLEAAAKKLLDTANANGGVDNSTVILAKYEGA